MAVEATAAGVMAVAGEEEELAVVVVTRATKFRGCFPRQEPKRPAVEWVALAQLACPPLPLPQ